MDNIPKITIEKRTFKINGNEDFILEYPSNYNDIVSKKLQNLEKEYDESQVEQEPNKNDLEENNKDNNDINENENQNECYAALGEDNENSNENGNNNNDIDNEKNDDININDDNEEGFQAVTVIEGGKKEINKDENKNNENKEEDNEEDDSDDFVEVREDNNNSNDKEYKKEDLKIGDFEFIEEQKKEEIKEEIKKEVKDEKKINKFKDPEKIKNLMKTIHMKEPSWAKNMKDSDFLTMAKNMIYNKNKKK